MSDADAGAFFFRDLAAANEASSSQLESCTTLGGAAARPASRADAGPC